MQLAKEDQDKIDAIKGRMETLLGSEGVTLLYADRDAAEGPMYIFGKNQGDAGVSGGGVPSGLLFHSEIDTVAVLDEKESALFSLRRSPRKKKAYAGDTELKTPLPADGPVTVTILPSKTLTLSWTDAKGAFCAQEFTWENASYSPRDFACKTR